MSEKTCAACDYKLDENAIQVKIGGQIVEVCCEECAQKLREANESAKGGVAALTRNLSLLALLPGWFW